MCIIYDYDLNNTLKFNNHISVYMVQHIHLLGLQQTQNNYEMKKWDWSSNVH